MSETHWVVAAADAGTRLDKFLAAGERLGSRPRALTALQKGKVFVNGDEAGPEAAGTRLQAGDTVRLWMDRPGSARRRAGTAIDIARGLRILYEDAALLVVDKPAGLLAVPLERRRESPSAYDLVAAHLRSTRGRPFVVHRIDRDTSGLVVFAKDPRSREALRQQFRAHEPERVYLAVVYGHPTPSSGTWRDRLVWDQSALIQKQTHPRDPRGKEAVCDYLVLEAFRDTSLVEVRLRTGKRNQIRLQARLRGHTLVGEQRYVFGPDELRPIRFGRQALHARELRFRHPADGRPLRFESPLPADLDELLVRLRRQGTRVQTVQRSALAEGKRQMWNKDEIKGKTEQVKGRIKREVGDALDDDRLREEGEVDETSGAVQHGVGKARRKVGEAIEDIGEQIKK